MQIFSRWCADRNITRPTEVTKPILERYQRHLFHFRREDGRSLTFQTQHKRLVQVRGYFKWLTRQNVLLWMKWTPKSGPAAKVVVDGACS